MILNNHADMVNAFSRLRGLPVRHLLLSGLLAFTLSACGPAVQPWVQPENSQDLKQLKMDNYLLKQEVQLYRKKLMLANLENRKLTEEMQRLQHGGGRQSSHARPSVQPVHKAAPALATRKSAPRTVSKPVSSKPTASKPAVSKPAPSRPVASRPSPAKRAASAEPAKESSPAPKPAMEPAARTSASKAQANADKAAPSTRPVSNPQTSEAGPAPAKAKDNSAKPQQASNWHVVMTLYFDSGQRYTSTDMRKRLRKFAASISKTAKIRVAGHTDSRTILQSSDAVQDNMAMSKERAWSVVRGLKAYGIDGKRMQVGGFGASRPVASNDTLEGRAKNRRVEILINE